VRASFTDPQGPKVWRLAPYLATIATFLFAIFGPLEGPPAVGLGVAAAIGFHLLGIFSFRQRKPRQVELVLGPGYVEVKRAGSRNQRISAKGIVGATTSRTPDGLLITLQHEKRDQPISFLVSSDAEAEKVRHALGIGHGGFGTIAWKSAVDSSVRHGWIGRIVAAAAIFIVAMLGFVIGGEAAALAGITLGPFGFIGAILGLSSLNQKHRQPSVVMTAEGLRLLTQQGWFALPYDAVLDVSEERRSIDFRVPPPYNYVSVAAVGQALGGMNDHERAIMLAQVTAASQRARGMGPHKNDVTGRLDLLRRNGQNARDWLVRLDMQGQMLHSGPGYRGNTLDTEDLWAILEDPEAEPELRAAAARVLKHSPQEGARVRIDAAVAAVRDEATNKRLRVAVDGDLDTASRELAFLDATEPIKNARVMNAR
jgi:hypothetical protein